MTTKVRFGGVSLVRYTLIRPFLKIKRIRFSFGSQKKLHWGREKTPTKDVISIEDGFIRSKGLGVHLATPCSLIFDSRGIYFDARYESDLEHLLNHQELTDDQLSRAKLIIASIVSNNVSKYNLKPSADIPLLPKDRMTILIPGQVEGDASIQFGSPVVKDNLTLVKTVRADNPDAYIIYKPHPDVLANQRAGEELNLITQYADSTILETSITQLIDAVDEVHTMTSLTGFEALLRNTKVVTYGLPFYSGWGLTSDKQVLSRRKRIRSVEELVACALILYPTYWHPKEKRACEVEDVISFISDQSQSDTKLSLLQKVMLGLRTLRNSLR